jgi:hypothetical protein
VYVVIGVERRADASTAYVLHVCTSQLASDARSAAVLQLEVEGITAPTEPGEYRWRAHVTPQSRPAYELQAVLPLPAFISLRVRYNARSRTATLSGRVIEGGKPLAKWPVALNGDRKEGSAGFWVARTNAQGAFRKTIQLKKTTDFSASVPMGIDSCADSSEPDGCLGATTVPPDAAFGTLWVSPRGGAVRAIRDGDQRIAEKLGVHAADLPEGFEESPGGGDDCLNPKHESNLTITGESTSPALVRYELGNPPHLAQVLGVTRVYAGAGQARSALSREARASTMRCLLSDVTDSRPSVKPLHLPAGAARVRAFRTQLTGEDITLTFDVIFLQRGRTVTSLQVALVNMPSDFEPNLITRLSNRMG